MVTLLGCSQRGPNADSRLSASDQPVDGHLVQVALQPWPTIVRVQGTLIADEITSVAARVPGRVVSVEYDLGDIVATDTILVKLDSREYVSKLDQARAQLAQARAAIGLEPLDLLEKLDPANSPPVREARAVLVEAQQQVQRLEPLFKQGAIVANDFETAVSLAAVAEARYNSAVNSVREKIALVQVQSALLELAEQELDDTVIPAPFPGAIQSRSVAVGTYVQVGQTLMEIAKIDCLRYRSTVPERYAKNLSVGQSVRISVGNTLYPATVSRIAPSLDLLSRSLTFEAMVDNSDGALRGGLFAQADLILDDQSVALVIHPSSLTRFAGLDKVWKVEDGQVREAVVRLGREIEGGIEVLSGLSPGDTILQDAREGRMGQYVGKSPTKQPLIEHPLTAPVATDQAVCDQSSPEQKKNPTAKSVSTSQEGVSIEAVTEVASPRT